MGKVLVTGAGGYIGRYVVDRLLEKGLEVVAADIRTDHINPAAERVSVDIFSGEPQIYQQLGNPDIMIHMAWLDGFVHNSPRHIEYLPYHYVFLKNMLAGGLPHFAVMGTMHEIGYYEGAVTEKTPTNPLSLYGIAKNTLRQICGLLQAEHPEAIIQWLRAYYIYGDDSLNHSIFAKIIAADEEGKATFPLNSGKNLYDFIEVKELARQIAAAAVQGEITGIINCCTGRPVSLGEQVERFIAQHHLSIRPEYGAFPDRPYDSPGIWGDPEKIQAIMNRELEATPLSRDIS